MNGLNKHDELSYQLPDSRKVVVRDITSHYFGGYYNVRLQAAAEVKLVEEMFECRERFEDALKRLGAVLRFERTLEKMAVRMDEVDAARQELIGTFQDNVLPYLSRPDFFKRYANTAYEKSLKRKTVLFAGKCS